MNNKQRQPEGFCRMLYRDTEGNEEWLWNSRNGVTPFIVRSKQGLEAQHVDWHRDQYMPAYRPAIGERMFINLTMERARELARKHVSENLELVLKHYGNEEEAVESIAESYYGNFGKGTTPTLVEVTRETVLPLLLEFACGCRYPADGPRGKQECPVHLVRSIGVALPEMFA